MRSRCRLALNAETTPLSVSNQIVFKSLQIRAQEAQEAGFSALTVNYHDNNLDPIQINQILNQYGLEAAPGFFHGAFYLPEKEPELLKRARQQAAFSQKLGQDSLFVSALVTPTEREGLVGRIGPGEPVSLSPNQYDHFAGLLNKIGAVWRDSGISLCFHPHVATYIEAPHEIETLLARTDPDLVKLGPDTGHLLFGGAKPFQTIKRHYQRLGGIHLKDIRSSVLDRVRRDHLSYREACVQGIWAELGTGDINFQKLFQLLQKKDFPGWLIVETDHTQLPTALESFKLSREYLRRTFGL